MESNITEQEYFDNDSLTEPHFDEEATIAAARPVVPLEEIKSQPYRKRLAIGVVAILGALIVGILGGTFIFKQRQNKPAAEIVDLAVAGSGATSQEVVEQPTTEIPIPKAPASGATATEATSSQPIISNPKPARTIARRESISREESSPSISREDQEESRHLDRIEARRARRAERRAGREAWSKRRPGEDLLRIREIFEGPRRP